MSKSPKTIDSCLIVHGSNNQICVDSRDIAIEFGRTHDNVLKSIDSLIADKTISRVEFNARDYKKRGKLYRCFELTKAGFLKAMPFIGGRKSREGQVRLVDAFIKLEVRLARQSKEREKLAYQVARLSGKDSREILTNAIRDFIGYAKCLGSKNADMYYCSITDAVYKSFLVLEPRATDARELMTTIQLSMLNLVELTAESVLREGMAASLPYKDIFQAMKEAINDFGFEKSGILAVECDNTQQQI